MGQMVLEVQQWLNKTYAGMAGYQAIPETGHTGWATTNALLVGLQIEIGVPYSDIESEINSETYTFGPTTQANCPNISANTTLDTPALKNIAMILQGGFWCKGINPGNFGPELTSEITTAIQTLQGWAGIEQTGTATYLEFRALLSMDAFRVIGNGDPNVRAVQQSINGQYANDMQQLIPCDGLVNRQLQAAFLFVLEMLDGFPPSACRYALEPSNFGYFAPNLLTVTPSINIGDVNGFVSLLQHVLYCSGYTDIDFTGSFDYKTEMAIEEFKAVMMLGAGAEVNGEIWESLLTSHGYSGRAAKACDTATTLSLVDAQNLKAAGYEVVGRYLTARFATSVEELENILKAGLRVVPIFEYGATQGYFNAQQGTEDAYAAFKAAQELGIPSGTTIYFAVDCDVLDGDVESTVIPYFEGINNQFKVNESPYKVGVYGARHICNETHAAGLTVNSFVSDMSTGYSGNIMNYPMPRDWAFNQFATTEVAGIGIDKDAYSGVDTGFGTINPPSQPVEQPTGEKIACDTGSLISPGQAEALANAGYKIVGRAINGSNALSLGELGHIAAAGLNIVPIYLSNMDINEDVYWNTQQGTEDAVNAAKLAAELGIPETATIYFTANYYNTQADLDYVVVPYFKGIEAQYTVDKTEYGIGIYGPRNACLATESAGYTDLSFVEDATNIKHGDNGYKMPSNWSFNQTGAGETDGLGYNEDTASGKDSGSLSVHYNYNRADALAYAAKYNGAKYSRNGNEGYNPNYFDYAQPLERITEAGYAHGSDCANFLSQCLHAGGLTENSNWYFKWVYNDFPYNTDTYNRIPKASPSWINTQLLMEYLVNNEVEEVILFNNLDDLNDKAYSYGIRPGDVAFLAYNYEKSIGRGNGIETSILETSVQYINSVIPSEKDSSGKTTSMFHHSMLIGGVKEGGVSIYSHTSNRDNFNVYGAFFNNDPADDDAFSENYFIVLKMK